MGSGSRKLENCGCERSKVHLNTPITNSTLTPVPAAAGISWRPFQAGPTFHRTSIIEQKAAKINVLYQRLI